MTFVSRSKNGPSPGGSFSKTSRPAPAIQQDLQRSGSFNNAFSVYER